MMTSTETYQLTKLMILDNLITDTAELLEKARGWVKSGYLTEAEGQELENAVRDFKEIKCHAH